MHRTQLFLPADLHRRAAEVARARRMSLGNLVREALREAIDEILLGEPFADPDPDPALSVDVDHYLYGAARPELD